MTPCTRFMPSRVTGLTVHASPGTVHPWCGVITMVCPAAKRSNDTQTSLDQLCQMDAGIEQALGLTQTFLSMIRELRGHDLEAWMGEAIHSGIVELAPFARGLQDDLLTVKTGLTLAWSHGVAEEQVHRLKQEAPGLRAGRLRRLTPARPAGSLGLEGAHHRSRRPRTERKICAMR